MNQETSIPRRILFIEDDPNLRRSLAFILRREGFEVDSAERGGDGLRKAQAAPPDLVLLDLQLPDMDGLELCRRLKERAATSRVRVIMLTGRTHVEDVVSGLDHLADDYVTKPFEPDILLARIRAVLRRDLEPPRSEPGVRRFRRLTIDLECRRVEVDGGRVELTRSEFDILALLSSHPERVFSRLHIIDRIRDDDYPVSERAIDFLIAGLRRKLGICADRVETVRGIGYRFHDPA